MKKKKAIMMLLAIILAMCLCMPVSAASKNVTKKYNKQVSKMLRNFDSYFGYGCGRGKKFKFDSYCRTTMVYLPNLYTIYDKSTQYAKSKLSSQMKLYFGTKSVKLKKFEGYKWFSNPSYLIQNNNGKIVYVGGDWGEVYPVGTVKKIVQTSSKMFTVTYQIDGYDSVIKKKCGKMGTYKIYLKKTKNKNGFIIANIKRTETKNVAI